MKAIILAGGQGTRFWPLSTKEKPKQFLNLISHETMLQLTYSRFQNWLPEEKIYVVTTEQYLSMVQEQLPGLPTKQIILEPSQRDTAPCVALTALHFLNQKDDEVVVIAPSDQYICQSDHFRKALLTAETAAEQGNAIVTLGIHPTGPETGYGYIKTRNALNENPVVLQVEKFIEKPDFKTAEQLIAQEDVFWNSGIFIWKPSTIAYNFAEFQPDMWQLLNENQTRLSDIYPLLKKVSIDYAILEKAESVYTVPVNFHWDDLGSWTSLERVQLCDKDNNFQTGDVITSSTKNCIVYTDRKTILIGVEDLIIASTAEGLLVCHKSEEQNIKKLLNNENLPTQFFEDN